MPARGKNVAMERNGQVEQSFKTASSSLHAGG
jgi:hypothetical protein